MRPPLPTGRSHAPLTRNLTARGLLGTVGMFGVLLAVLFAPVATLGVLASVVLVALLLGWVVRLRRRSATPAPEYGSVTR